MKFAQYVLPLSILQIATRADNAATDTFAIHRYTPRCSFLDHANLVGRRRQNGRRPTCSFLVPRRSAWSHELPSHSDYRGLKKRITAIRKAQQGVHYSASPEDSPNAIATPPSTPRLSSEGAPVKSPILRRNTVTASGSQAFSSALQEIQRTPTLGGRNISFHRPAKSLSSRCTCTPGGAGVGFTDNSDSWWNSWEAD